METVLPLANSRQARAVCYSSRAMGVEYRAIHPDEWPQAMELWTTVFGVGAWLFQSLHEGTEDRNWDHTSVAVDESGRIVSAVDLFMRPIRGHDGNPLTMAGVGSVATYDDARKQGHSGKLLERALDVMQGHCCNFSMLTTGVNAHYARYGWFNSPLKFRTGALREIKGNADSLITLDDEGIDQHLDAFVDLYALDNHSRPLSHVRSAQYWRAATRPRMGHQNMPRFGPVHAERRVSILAGPQSPAGYVVWAQEGEVTFIYEACGEVEPLLASLGAKLNEGSTKHLHIELPNDEPWNSAIDAIMTDLAWEDSPWWMSRNLPGGLSADEIRTLIAAPGAHHWSLDAF
ncbi:MAG: GNAT family N-acetyltransferase [Fimbriimonas sp.]